MMIMNSSLVSTLLWGYWANIVYIIGMIGYLTIDIISYTYISLHNTISYIIYIFLAIIFVIDAVLYTIDWYISAIKLRTKLNEPKQYRSDFFACIFQNLGSYFYLISAVLNFDKILMIKKNFLFNFLGIISFLIESILTLFIWLIFSPSKSSNNLKNTSFWAHIFNLIANLIYLCSIILGYYSYIFHKNINIALIVQIFGDIVYLLDAYLYHVCWQEFNCNIFLN